MTFRRAAQAALAGRVNPGWVVLTVSLILVALSASCGGKSSSSSGASHNGYISVPATGSVMLLHIDNSTGAITLGPETPPVVGNSPNAVVLHPSGKFLYAVNSDGNTISIFNVAADGTLTLSATPTPACQAGCGPRAAVIDPSGNYLLVSNTFSNNVSVFAIGSGGATLSPVQGSPFPAGPGPTDLKITSKNFVYVVNPGIAKVEGFSLNTSNGFLTPSSQPPVSAGAGLNAIAIDPTGRFLYTANTSDNTVSAFTIDPSSGFLNSITGSPYCSTPGCTGAGSGPGALAVDTSARFLYVSTPGSSNSIWVFSIAGANGELAPLTNSPFSLSAGTLFLLMEPSGKFFYVGNQSPSGSNIAGYSYDPSTGVPTAISGSPFSAGSSLGGMLITH